MKPPEHTTPGILRDWSVRTRTTSAFSARIHPTSTRSVLYQHVQVPLRVTWCYVPVLRLRCQILQLAS